MKLRALRLEHVRRFDRPVQIDGMGNGLNLLCAANEQGKSTLFDALHALFYARHGSRAQDVLALRPHAGGAPEIRAEIESEQTGPVTLVKRWLSRPEARIERDGRVIARADEAEAVIADLVGGAEGGPAGLLWVRQGLHGLEDGTGKARDAALAARRDLLSSVAGEVDAMTGGRRMDAALARCREELTELATPGRAQPRGAYKAALDEAAALADRAQGLAETARALSEALKDRRRCREELAALDDPEAMEERRARLAVAEAAYEAAEKHAEHLDAARRSRDLARLEARQAAERLFALREARATRETANRACQEADVALEDARQRETQAAEAAAEAERTRAEAAAAKAGADAARREAERRAAAADG
ncbi:AAA family ATPase, partial [Rhodosalinus sp. FB01]|uniref:AAA family ATPase n=1 Tax=Rhodosalinus sp. FB01 TaxID=3239194 RepID=UPI00352562B5